VRGEGVNREQEKSSKGRIQGTESGWVFIRRRESEKKKKHKKKRERKKLKGSRRGGEGVPDQGIDRYAKLGVKGVLTLAGGGGEKSTNSDIDKR